jgi:outer membrane protein TolC
MHRNKIANLQNGNAELQYKAERLNILLLAKQTCIELAYYNALVKEYSVRLQNAGHIAEATKTKMDKGEANILEHSKAQINLTAIQAAAAQMETERTALLLKLKQLNGGKEPDIYELQITKQHSALANNEDDETHNLQFVIRNFEEWYAAAESKNPLLQYVSAQIEISRQEIKLNRAMALPRFSAGYMSEKVVGQHFQGISLGMSIPLWENKNRVKQAKMQAQAAETAFADSRIQFYSRLQTLYQKAAALQQNAHKLRQSFKNNNSEPLLKKALDAGEISLLNYLLEIEYYYETVNAVLETERDCELAIAELQSVIDY